nr:SorE [Stagonospora sp.]
MALAKDPAFLPEVWTLYGLGAAWLVLRIIVRIRMMGLSGLDLADGLAVVALAAWTYTAVAVEIRRIGVLILLSSGIFVLGACILRVALTAVTGTSVLVIARWGIREIFVAIIAVNAAAIRPIFRPSFWTSSPSKSRCRYSVHPAHRLPQYLFPQPLPRLAGRLNRFGPGDSDLESTVHAWNDAELGNQAEFTMQRHGLLTYFRLKILTTFFKIFLRVASRGALKRDRELAGTIDVRRERVLIPSRDNGRNIGANIYSTPGNKAAQSPVIVNWHGSGFIFPLLGSDALYISQIVRDTGLTVIDADYRKGPDTTFPGPLEDAEDTLRWIASQERFDSGSIGLSGFSAGGTIALAAASSLVAEIPDIRIHIVVAIYPGADFSIDPEDKRVRNPKQAHSPFFQHLINDCYAPDVSSRKDPRISPAFADAERFPQTALFLTCDGDIFEPEASALADKLSDGKRRVIHRVLKDVHHGFDKGCVEGTRDWDQREEAYALVVKTLKESFDV